MYPFCGANRHGALVYNYNVVCQDPSKVAGDTQHIFQVCGAIFAGRGGQCQEYDGGIFDARSQVGGEIQTPFFQVAQEYFFEARLIDGDLSVRQFLHLAMVDIYAGDIISRLGETGAGDQADVTGSYDCDLHDCDFVCSM